MNILLGVTGSVAATLTPKLVAEFQRRGHEVEVVATASSLYFWNPTDLPTSTHSPSLRSGEGEKEGEKRIRVWTEQDEWPNTHYVRDQLIPHIALGDWADLLVIAPCSAQTLAKLANGMCDNLLTSVARAWHRERLIVIAPAMNTRMWEHPATQEHLAKLHGWYPHLTVIQPVERRLACGDVGIGAMAPIETIADAIEPKKED